MTALIASSECLIFLFSCLNMLLIASKHKRQYLVYQMESILDLNNCASGSQLKKSQL